MNDTVQGPAEIWSSAQGEKSLGTADIDPAGRLTVRVGATLVRHSDPASEVLETRAKAAGLLAAATAGPPAPSRGEGSRAVRRLADDARVRAALAGRNDRLAPFWMRPPTAGRGEPALVGRRMLVIDAEDTFTAMLSHQLCALGLVVDVRPHHAVAPADAADGYDLVLLGPGPGDPQDLGDPKIATLHAVASRLLDDRTPFLAVCLGHQVLSTALGLPVVRKPVPSQGEQREIDWFGRRERVGFYNTFAAECRRNVLDTGRTPGPVFVSRDELSGEVYGLRGARFASAQFHPESVLTTDGPGILAESVLWALGRRPTSRARNRAAAASAADAVPRQHAVAALPATAVAPAR